MIGRILLAAALAAAATAAAAQQGGQVLTLRQVEARFPGMNEVHIRKCDHNGDDLYDQAELACVSSIYRVMYLSD